MSSPIDPIRRAAAARRARRASDRDRTGGLDGRERLLPVPVDAPVESAPPPSAAAPDGAAVFAAQLLGQDGQKRGLRGGPPVLNAAKTTYSSTEWSGPADRRSPKGRLTKTDI